MTQVYYRTDFNYGTAAPELEPEYVPVIRKKQKDYAKILRSWNIVYAFTFAISLVAVVLLTVNMLSVKSAVTTNHEAIESKQSALTKLRADNDAIENNMKSSLNLDYISQVAREELGMTYPTDEQIIFYTRTNNGFVRQYEDIPNS